MQDLSCYNIITHFSGFEKMQSNSKKVYFFVYFAHMVCRVSQKKDSTPDKYPKSEILAMKNSNIKISVFDFSFDQVCALCAS